MIRQRVNRHGIVYPLEPASELAGCQVPASEIGVIKEAPVRKWMAAKREWDSKFSSVKRKIQKQRAKEMALGYQQFGNGEVPPPSALAGRRKAGAELKEEKKKRSLGLSMWALWGSKHDEKTMILEQENNKEPEMKTAHAQQGTRARALDHTENNEMLQMGARKIVDDHSRSRRRTVRDENQTRNSYFGDENIPATVFQVTEREEPAGGEFSPAFANNTETPSLLLGSSSGLHESELKRPKHNGIAYPFTVQKDGASASMTTLTSTAGIPPVDEILTEGAITSGITAKAPEVEA
jgi:hypothetical protein